MLIIRICSLLYLTIVIFRFLQAPLSYLHSPPSRKPVVGWWQNCCDVNYTALVYWHIIFVLSNTGFLQNIPNFGPEILLFESW